MWWWSFFLSLYFVNCSGCVSFGEARLCRGAGKPCEENQTPENQTPKPHSGWVEGLNWYYHQPCDICQCPTWSSCQCLWSLHLGSKHQGVQRGAEHLSFSSTPLHLLKDKCHEKYFCEQLLALGTELNWTNPVSSADPWNSNETPSELDFISGMEKINAVLPFNSVSSGKVYWFRACPRTPPPHVCKRSAEISSAELWLF